MTIELTAIFMKVPDGFIGFIADLPGVQSRGSTLEETRSGLEKAVRLILEANPALVEERLKGPDIRREPLRIPDA